MHTLRIGIVGYGNLARGIELAAAQQDDIELVAVFSRRNGVKSESGTPVYRMDELDSFVDKIDVLMLCGGSANDLMAQARDIGAKFHIVDSFDTHAKIEDHFTELNAVSKAAGKVSLISVGWDPGLFSLQRLYGETVLPHGKNYTFWGRGISQGHSNAIRRIPGVADAKQYTVPKEEYLDRCRGGEQADIRADESHLRECYVVLEDGADAASVEHAIKTMPDYFVGYETVVHFVSQETLDRDHAGMPHGGFVLRAGETRPEETSVIEYSLKLDSNPSFTASVLVAYARALMRLAAHGATGCFTVFDIPPAYLSPKAPKDLRKLL